MGTATFIKRLHEGDPKRSAVQMLYRLDPPIAFTRYNDDCEEETRQAEYVVVSATHVMGTPETYIFAADESGEIQFWCELDGSYKGGMDHVAALKGAGYEVSKPRECRAVPCSCCTGAPC